MGIRRLMIMGILRAIGNGIITIIKWILIAILKLLECMLGVAKVFLLLFALVARFVLALISGARI